MTISDYSIMPLINVNYILRDSSDTSIGVWVTNQETKETTFCDALTEGELNSYFYDGYFTVNVTDISASINKNTTLTVSVVDSKQMPIYRDIVVFSDRLDTEADYEQNNNKSEYTFV